MGREPQRYVVVRIDYVIYVLVSVIAILALATIACPDRIDLQLIVTLGGLLTGILTGWLTYMRLSQNHHST